MYNLDKKDGNTGEMGRYFWRIENSTGKDALENCYTWENLQKNSSFRDWYYIHIRNDFQMACPCSSWQARLDQRFFFDWINYPDWCYISRFPKVFKNFLVSQQCCYSSNLDEFGSLRVGPPDGGRVKVVPLYSVSEEVYTDEQAYKFCCVDTIECDPFYFYRPSDDCLRYRPPRRRKFLL